MSNILDTSRLETEVNELKQKRDQIVAMQNKVSNSNINYPQFLADESNQKLSQLERRIKLLDRRLQRDKDYNEMIQSEEYQNLKKKVGEFIKKDLRDGEYSLSRLNEMKQVIDLEGMGESEKLFILGFA